MAILLVIINKKQASEQVSELAKETSNTMKLPMARRDVN